MIGFGLLMQLKENKNNTAYPQPLPLKTKTFEPVIILAFCFLVNRRGYMDHSASTEAVPFDSLQMQMFCLRLCMLFKS